mgnify:CR=1 FL=1
MEPLNSTIHGIEILYKTARIIGTSQKDIKYGQVIPHLKALEEYISNMLVSYRVYDIVQCYATCYSKTGYIQSMI